MISSVCLCCQQNTNKDFFKAFPPLSVTPFSPNGQCWVWGKVSEDVGGMEIVLFLLEMSAVPCVFQALMCQSGQCSLTAAVLIRPAQFFVTLCHIHFWPRKEPHPFIWTNQFLLFGDTPVCLQVHISVWASWTPDGTNLCVAICPRKQWGEQKLYCSRKVAICSVNNSW